jgi:PKD repeat protein
MKQVELPSDKLKKPARPWATVGFVAGVAVILSGVGVGAYGLTREPEPLTPRAQYEIPANADPVAVTSATTADLTVTVDGTGSTDPDGAITGYLWDFGDGTTAEEPTTSHTYAAAGTYTVTLTVTDDGSRPAEGATTVDVSVTEPAPPPPPGFNGGGSGPAAGAPGSLVPFVPSSDPNNASGGDYLDPGIYCQSGSASGNPPRCD